MKTLKNRNWNFGLIVVLFSAFFMESCGEDENILKGSEPSHRVVVMSQMFNDNTINVNSKIDFADVSQGIVKREWIFPAEALVTLTGATTDAKVSAVFGAVGTFQVRLNQTFKQSAFSERDTVRRGIELDTAYTIVVLPRINISSVKANILNGDVLGDEINLTASTPTEISFGSVLRFTYESEGNPATVTGGFDDAVFIKHDTANNYFDLQYGVLNKVFSLKAILMRSQPQSSDTIVYSDFVKAVPSSEPVTLDKLFVKNGSIVLDFSRGLEASSLRASDFSVSITTNGGATLSPSIESATISPENDSWVVLTLSGDHVYDDDDATLTFTGGKLISQDAYTIESFTDEAVDNTPVNYLAESEFDYSFEDPDVTWPANDVYVFDWWPTGPNFTSQKTTAQAHHGNTSLKVTVAPGPGNNVAMFPKNKDNSVHGFQVDDNVKLKMSAWVYIESRGGTGNNLMRLRMPEVERWNVHDPIIFFNNGAINTGEWVYVEEILTSALLNGSIPNSIGINPTNQGSENLIFYIDHMTLQKHNPRP